MITWTFEQAYDQGGNPIPHSYEIIETGRDGIPVIVAEVYTEDNARVIAAAKKMLAALKAMVRVHREQDTVGVLPADKAIAYGQAEAVIAEVERDCTPKGVKSQ